MISCRAFSLCCVWGGVGALRGFRRQFAAPDDVELCISSFFLYAVPFLFHMWTLDVVAVLLFSDVWLLFVDCQNLHICLALWG